MQKVVQVAIVCKNIEATAKHWADLLGVEMPRITTTRPGSEVKVSFRGKPSNGRAKLAFIKMGQVVLEFIEPVGGDTSWKLVLDQHGESVHHLGFQVADLDKTAQALSSLGYREEHRGRYDKDNGTYVYFDTREGLGVTVELLHSDK
jgi:catechol 2,3-dioxygenase-like lactoylglutathione lyase family enzyme